MMGGMRIALGGVLVVTGLLAGCATPTNTPGSAPAPAVPSSGTATTTTTGLPGVSLTRSGGLALGGIMFVLYPAVRPWHDESTVDGAAASMQSGAWVAAHLFGMLGFILVSLGVLAVRDVLAGTRAHGVAGAAVVATWLGTGLT